MQNQVAIIKYRNNLLDLYSTKFEIDGLRSFAANNLDSKGIVYLKVQKIIEELNESVYKLENEEISIRVILSDAQIIYVPKISVSATITDLVHYIEVCNIRLLDNLS